VVSRDLRGQYHDELTKTLTEAQQYPVKNTDVGLKELLKAIDDGKAGVMQNTPIKILIRLERASRCRIGWINI